MVKKHELHHFPAFPQSIAHQKSAKSLQHRAWGQAEYVCTLSLLLFASTASRPARCQAAPSQNLGCSISFALAQDRSLVHPSPRHPIRPAALRSQRGK